MMYECKILPMYRMVELLTKEDIRRSTLQLWDTVKLALV